MILAQKELPGGRTADICLLTFGRARINVGPTGQFWYVDSW